ncbi:MAG: methylmalonyl-CoA mutase family protein [Polyangiales bacterium]
MTFPTVSAAEWRAQVEAELQGAPFEKSLVYKTAEGLSVEPLYTALTTDPGLPGAAPFTRGESERSAVFAVCTRHERYDRAAIDDDLSGGADALWLSAEAWRADPSLGAGVERVVDDVSVEDFTATLTDPAARFTLGIDPVASLVRGATDDVDVALAAMARGAVALRERFANGRAVVVSTLPFHDAGADAADELALSLSTGALYLDALLDAGLTVADAAAQITLRVAVGRDTFGELCKLRALRVCWHKLLAAHGAGEVAPPRVHAVSSWRTLTRRDPWVNLLRVTTQVFAAALGGARLITPATYDAVDGDSPLGRRAARNTALVLRDESHLGRVVDPAGGAYFFEARTDVLAREAWTRFQQIERDGGVVKALRDGSLAARLERAHLARLDAIAKRKEPITGVSEFANLDERVAAATATETRGLPRHRDAEVFEDLRDRADALSAEGALPTVSLVTLGPPKEHRARVGFARGFFSAGGLRAKESTADAAGSVACLCGSDERYAAEAEEVARSLKSRGVKTVLLAGRGGEREAALREAGVDGFIYLGCDVVKTLAALLEVAR